MNSLELAAHLAFTRAIAQPVLNAAFSLLDHPKATHERTSREWANADDWYQGEDFSVYVQTFAMGDKHLHVFDTNIDGIDRNARDSRVLLASDSIDDYQRRISQPRVSELSEAVPRGWSEAARLDRAIWVPVEHSGSGLYNILEFHRGPWIYRLLHEAGVDISTDEGAVNTYMRQFAPREELRNPLPR